ncbi:MAG: response regulator, partial [Deltaproteobacteria bacterium]|nr:response regulator [Deltaproteobacteria bacterium]
MYRVMNGTEQTIRVLLVEDDEDDFVLIRDLLEEAGHPRFELTWVQTYEEAVETAGGTHDVYLLDYRLGARDGLELLQALRELGVKQPLIMLTGQGEQEVDEEAMRVGVADYLEKTGISSQLLARSIRYALERSKNLAELHESEARFRGLFMGAGIGIALVNVEGRILEANPALERMLGIRRWDLPGTLFKEAAYEPEDARAFSNAFSDLLDHVTHRTQLEIRLSRRGTPWWGRLTLSVLDVSQPATRFAAVMVEDVTERRDAIEALKRSENELRVLSLKLMDTQENERKAVSQELHDSVGSGLSALKYSLESLLLRDDCTEELRAGLEKATEFLSENIEETRRICASLRPTVLDDLGILATINWFCREFQEMYGKITIDKNLPVSEEEVP